MHKNLNNDFNIKIQGKAKFTTDLFFPGMLYGVIFRSPVASGTIKNIDLNPAIQSPGVESVINFENISTPRNGLVVFDQRIFAYPDLTYIGEPIVAIAANSIENAYDSLDKILIEIDEDVPITNVTEAIKYNSRCVHPNWESFLAPDNVFRDKNIVGKMVYEDDGVDEAFSSSETIIENKFTSGRQYQAYLEPRGVVVLYENNRYIVHVSHQFPFNLRDRLAKSLDVLPSSIQIIGHHIGGGFGAKLDMSIEPYACLLSKFTQKPVKIIHTREEDLSTCPCRENGLIKIRTGLDKTGKIIATDLSIFMDSGASATSTPYLNSIPIFTTGVPYKSGKTKISVLSVYTNTPPTGSFRGVSGTYLNFAIERQMDEISKYLNKDRYDFRIYNLVGHGDRFLNNQSLKNPSMLHQSFGKLKNVFKMYKKNNTKNILSGIGIASTVWLTNPLPGSATIKINEDDTISLITAATDNGSGAVSIGLRTILAKEFDVTLDKINISFPDTDVCAYDAGSQGSRTTHVVGKAIQNASTKIKQKIFELTSDLLESSIDDLIIQKGHVAVKGSPKSKISLSDVANYSLSKLGPLVETGSYVTPTPEHNPDCASGFMFPTFPNHSYHAHCAEVEINQLTGHIKIVKYLVVQEVGKIIHYDSIISQIHGGVAQGIGHVLYENLDIGNDGRYLQNSMEYHIPLAEEIPFIECKLLEDPNNEGPFGAKGVAEPPIIPVASAVANAVSDAIGIKINSFPIKPIDIFNLLNNIS